MRITKSYTVRPHDGCELIAESFGVTGGYVNNVADIDVPDDWQVLYITGESGCGKTTILREIADSLGTIIYHEDIKHDIPLFSIYGTSEDEQMETLRLLTSVGISDAVLWMNSYDELSDSQQARTQVACAMHDSDVVVISEWQDHHGACERNWPQQRLHLRKIAQTWNILEDCQRSGVKCSLANHSNDEPLVKIGEGFLQNLASKSLLADGLAARKSLWR